MKFAHLAHPLGPVVPEIRVSQPLVAPVVLVARLPIPQSCLKY